MKVHFICRGNIFRSFIAETYLRSLDLEGVETYSSGTLAERYKEANAPKHLLVREVIENQGLLDFAKDSYAGQLTQKLINEAGINVFVNQPAYEEADAIFQIPDDAIVWRVRDFDEARDTSLETTDETKEFISKMFNEIVTNVDKLVEEQQLAT